MKVILLQSARNPAQPSPLYIQANKIVSWSEVDGHTELAVEGVPFPILVRESADEVMSKIWEALR